MTERIKGAVEKASKEEFVPDRENDELTAALGNPEHPGRTRGHGAKPWKLGFLQDADSYRSRQRKKAKEADKFRNLEEKLAATQATIESMVERQVTGVHQ